MRRAIVAIAVLALAGVLLPAVAHAQKLVLLVRHAERADGGAPAASMTGTPADPPLSAAGEARAARLAATLSDAGISGIFATKYRRTQDTAKPLAAKIGVPVTIALADGEALAAKLKADHPNGVVLVVGHSNTIPGVIKAFGGPEVVIPDGEYGNLFVLVPATGALMRLRY